MATTLVSVEEYLNTSYPDGDREYVDGRVVERNLGEIDHGDVQTNVALYLRQHYERFWAAVEIRVQVKPTRFRVPDVIVMEGPRPKGRIITIPPILVIEVLSPEDRAGELQEKLDDYFAFGVPTVWILDPYKRRGYIHTPGRSEEPADGVLRAGAIEVPLSEIIPAR